jgi:hypothetical protein
VSARVENRKNMNRPGGEGGEDRGGAIPLTAAIDDATASATTFLDGTHGE